MIKIKNQIKSSFFFSQAGTWSLSLPKGLLVTKNQLKLIRPLSFLCDGVSILTLSLLLCLVITSCSKTPSSPPTSLPAYTENGSNVVACRVNGRVYVSGRYFTNRDGNFNPIQIDNYTNPSILYIKSIAWYEHNQEDVDVILVNLKQKTNTDKTNEIRYANDRYLRSTSDVYFYKNKKQMNINILKNDTINRIIAGKFNAILFNPNDSFHLATDSAIITDGTFDIKY
jgi:hypothetical protein